MATPAKKTTKKATKTVTVVEITDEERWALWQARLLSIVLSLVCIGGIINELFIEAKPREQALLFLGSLLGLPALVAGAKRLVGGGGG